MPDPEPVPDTGDIIIKGASVHVTFDSDNFKKEKEPGSNKQHHHHDKLRITRIRVEDASGNKVFDQVDENGMKFTVRIYTA